MAAGDRDGDPPRILTAGVERFELSRPLTLRVGTGLRGRGDNFGTMTLLVRRPVAPTPRRPQQAQAATATSRPTRGIPGSARVVVIGDSHTAGVFGASLKARLASHLKGGGGKLQSFTGVPSASVTHFLHGTDTRAGSATFHTPRLATLLDRRPRPTHLVVALGTNMLFNSKAENAAQIRALLAKADHFGVKVTWVGPPDVHGYGGNLAGPAPERHFYEALREVNASRRLRGLGPMQLVDSRPFTEEHQTLDGVHFGGAVARRWARGVLGAAI